MTLSEAPHQKTYSDERLFDCPVPSCTRKFKHRYLQGHIETHSGEHQITPKQEAQGSSLLPTKTRGRASVSDSALLEDFDNPPRTKSPSSIIPRDHPHIELKDEVFPPDDARSMSPPRSSVELAEMVKQAQAEETDRRVNMRESLALNPEIIGTVEGLVENVDEQTKENKGCRDLLDMDDTKE